MPLGRSAHYQVSASSTADSSETRSGILSKVQPTTKPSAVRRPPRYSSLLLSYNYPSPLHILNFASLPCSERLKAQQCLWPRKPQMAVPRWSRQAQAGCFDVRYRRPSQHRDHYRLHYHDHLCHLRVDTRHNRRMEGEAFRGFRCNRVNVRKGRL